MIFPEYIGWIGNACFIFGVFLLAKKKSEGFIANIFGNILYSIQGKLMGLSSLFILSIFLVLINLYGYYNWRKKNV